MELEKGETHVSFWIAPCFYFVLLEFFCERLSQQGKSGLVNRKVVLLLESAVATKNQSNTLVLILTLLIAITNNDCSSFSKPEKKWLIWFGKSPALELEAYAQHSVVDVSFASSTYVETPKENGTYHEVNVHHSAKQTTPASARLEHIFDGNNLQMRKRLIAYLDHRKSVFAVCGSSDFVMIVVSLLRSVLKEKYGPDRVQNELIRLVGTKRLRTEAFNQWDDLEVAANRINRS